MTYTTNTGTDATPKILVPPWQTKTIISLFHDKLYAHCGMFKTINKIREKFAWRGMNADVNRHIANCHTCLTSKHSINPEKKLRHNIQPPSTAFQTIVIDHLGAFQQAPCKSRYVLTVIDVLTSFVLCFPLRSSGSEETAKCLYDNVFTTFGFPQTIISDNSSSFTSGIYSQIAKKFNIKLTFASAYNPRSTAKAERAHSSVLNILRCLTKNNPENWVDYLSTACNVINNTKHAINQVTPSECIFGRDTSALISFDLDNDEKTLSQFIEQMKIVQTWALQQAKINKTEYDTNVQDQLNMNKTVSSLPENATVFWKKPTLTDPHSNKKLQSNIKEYIAFDIHHDSCQLRDPQTNQIHKTRVTLSQLIYPKLHANNIKLNSKSTSSKAPTNHL